MRSEPSHRSEDAALVCLLHALQDRRFSFVTPAPHTHRRVLARSGRRGGGVEDLLGWSLSCEAAGIDPELIHLMGAAGILVRRGSMVSSRLRVASAAGALFLHSAYPVQGDAHVFFGPDSYRFIDFLRAELPARASGGGAVLDIGAGSGVGGVFAARQLGAALSLTDINPDALRLARVNALAAGVAAGLHCVDGLPPGGGAFDVIVANPPYIAGSGLTYSDGGADLGRAVAIRWARKALPRLAAGGRFLLYSGAPIKGRHDGLRDQLAALAAEGACRFAYRELDPDVFSATLATPAYRGVERIAAVGAVFERSR